MKSVGRHARIGPRDASAHTESPPVALCGLTRGTVARLIRGRQLTNDRNENKHAIRNQYRKHDPESSESAFNNRHSHGCQMVPQCDSCFGHQGAGRKGENNFGIPFLQTHDVWQLPQVKIRQEAPPNP